MRIKKKCKRERNKKRKEKTDLIKRKYKKETNMLVIKNNVAFNGKIYDHESKIDKMYLWGKSQNIKKMR